MLRGINAPVYKEQVTAMLNAIDGPLRALELAGMFIGGRYRILGEAEEMSA